MHMEKDNKSSWVLYGHLHSSETDCPPSAVDWKVRRFLILMTWKNLFVMTNPPFLSKCIFILPLLQPLMFNIKCHLLLQQAQSPSVAGLRVLLSCALSPAVVSIPNLPWGHHCRCDRSSHKSSFELPTPEYRPCFSVSQTFTSSLTLESTGAGCAACTLAGVGWWPLHEA